MNTKERFEQWLRSDYPEADTTLLPNGEYRNHTIRAQYECWQGCCREWVQAMGLRAEVVDE